MKYLIFTFLFFSQVSLAGNEFGNGGDVIVCPDGSVTFLDWFEAQERYDILILPPQSTTLIGKVEELLSRLLPRNPFRHALYLADARDFFNQIKFIPHGRRLTDIPDADKAFIPDGCKLQQLIVQGKPTFPGDKWYTIDKEYWDRLPMDQQAAVIAHEIILKDATINSRQTNSRPTRYFNAQLLGDRLRNISTADWYSMFSSIKFDHIDIGGMYIDLSSSNGPVSDSCFGGTLMAADPNRVHTVGLARFQIVLDNSEINKAAYERVGVASYDRGCPPSNGEVKLIYSARIERDYEYSKEIPQIYRNFIFPGSEKFKDVGFLPHQIVYEEKNDKTYFFDVIHFDNSFVSKNFPFLRLADANQCKNVKVRAFRIDLYRNSYPTVSKIKLDSMNLDKSHEKLCMYWVTPQGALVYQFDIDSNSKITNVNFLSANKILIQGQPFYAPYDMTSTGLAFPFHANGVLKVAKTKENSTLKFIDGSTRDVPSDSECEFNDQELAIQCSE